MAIVLKRKKTARGAAVGLLAKRFGLSIRQAHRYVQQAASIEKPCVVPETKLVFTVKLPASLIKVVRCRARAQRQSISDLVSGILKDFFGKKIIGNHG